MCVCVCNLWRVVCGACTHTHTTRANRLWDAHAYYAMPNPPRLSVHSMLLHVLMLSFWCSTWGGLITKVTKWI